MNTSETSNYIKGGDFDTSPRSLLLSNFYVKFNSDKKITQCCYSLFGLIYITRWRMKIDKLKIAKL